MNLRLKFAAAALAAAAISGQRIYAALAGAADAAPDALAGPHGQARLAVRGEHRDARDH